MPSRYLVPGVISQAQLSNTASSEVLTTPVQIGIGEPFPSAKAPLQEESNAQQQPVPGGSTSGMRLDPALQKQRENLLALLANKRRNANAGLGEATAKPANNGVENEEQEDALVASKREDSNGASVGSGSSSISANDDKVEEIQERKEVKLTSAVGGVTISTTGAESISKRPHRGAGGAGLEMGHKVG
ncbi:hypothetical protein [Sporisorium scitamineum]|uniref:Uncharacterized protein n=1 Tax=Sporisorium scitamineum TaxID=49012 RepID=A0A0F7SBL7_9BASI|nr:hypothetical protein [Sporisorium scitamineum]